MRQLRIWRPFAWSTHLPTLPAVPVAPRPNRDIRHAKREREIERERERKKRRERGRVCERECVRERENE